MFGSRGPEADPRPLEPGDDVAPRPLQAHQPRPRELHVLLRRLVDGDLAAEAAQLLRHQAADLVVVVPRRRLRVDPDELLEVAYHLVPVLLDDLEHPPLRSPHENPPLPYPGAKGV